LTSSSNQNQVEVTEPIVTTTTTMSTQLAATVTKKPTGKKVRIKPKNSIIIPLSSS
jgi:hypothetical protein